MIYLAPSVVTGAALVVVEMFLIARALELRGEILRWLVPRAPPTCLLTLQESWISSRSCPARRAVYRCVSAADEGAKGDVVR